MIPRKVLCQFHNFTKMPIRVFEYFLPTNNYTEPLLLLAKISKFGKSSEKMSESMIFVVSKGTLVLKTPILGHFFTPQVRKSLFNVVIESYLKLVYNPCICTIQLKKKVMLMSALGIMVKNPVKESFYRKRKKKKKKAINVLTAFFISHKSLVFPLKKITITYIYKFKLYFLFLLFFYFNFFWIYT